MLGLGLGFGLGFGGGVTTKEIDRTWMCDSMETRDAAPQVCPRSRETKDSALSGVCSTDDSRVTLIWQRFGALVYRLTPVPIICAPESFSMYGHMDTWTVMVSQMAR